MFNGSLIERLVRSTRLDVGFERPEGNKSMDPNGEDDCVEALIPRTSTATIGNLSHVFGAWEALSIRFCIWKSSDRLLEGLAGNTDLDVLVERADASKTFACLRKNGWFPALAERWRRYPEVHDWYAYDPRVQRFLHLHIHFRLVMGEKFVKSLAPPLEALYLETRQRLNGIPCVAPELEFIVFILRLIVKLSWIDYARMIRRRSGSMLYRDFIPEYERIRARCDRYGIDKFLKHPAMAWLDGTVVLDAYEDIHSLTLSRRCHLRRSLAPYRRYGAVGRVAVDLQSRYHRWREGVGKRLERGCCVAFCGPDGAGKTTLVDGVLQALSSHFKVSHVYLGGNVKTAMWPRRLYHSVLWLPYLGIRKVAKLTRLRRTVALIERLYWSLDTFMTTLEKLRRYQRGMAALQRGEFVLYERFPLFSNGGDGLPVPDRLILSAHQHAMYRRFHFPDSLFVIRIQADIAIQRRPDQDPYEIRSKATAFERFASEQATNERVVILDGTKSVEELSREVLERVQRDIMPKTDSLAYSGT